MSTTPTAIGRVTLTVHDLDAVSDFYQRVVGLHRLAGDGQGVTLGSAGTALLELRRDPQARRSTAREAGLFHTAFLLPTRSDLGRWVRHAAQVQAPIVGASDHIVSEALYLSDPEGNGIEIYSDRPRAGWTWTNGSVRMATEALDIDDLVAKAGMEPWQGVPDGSVVGHVHLQVGAIPPAEAFYAGVLGMGITAHYPGGTFYAADGYHHHLATNVWNSRGAGVRTQPSTGLADVEIIADAAVVAAVRARATDTASTTGPLLALQDPWGTAITLVAR